MSKRKGSKYNSQSISALAGILLRYSGAAYIADVSAALRDPKPYWANIRQVEANFEIVSNLIPTALQEGAESWLILYRSDMPQELLVLPFPDSSELLYLRDRDTLHHYVLAMLRIIRGKPTKQWYPERGYWHLKRHLELAQPSFNKPKVRRFQLVRLNAPVDSFLGTPQVRWQQIEQKGIQDTLNRTSRRIQQQRNEMLSLVLEIEDEVRRQEFLIEFERLLSRENHRLFEWVQSKWKHHVIIPSIVQSFGRIMDEETRKFLVSAINVERFACEHLPEDFDFSLPGSGLWKSVELELNLSFGWYLRRCFGIVDDDPWAAIESSSVRITIQAGKRPINLNEREKENPHRLRSIMLGNIEYILRSSHMNGVISKLQLFLNDEWLKFMTSEEEGALPYIIGQIRAIRNKNAHISSMSHEHFERLYSLVLSSEQNPIGSTLGRILQLKQKMLDLWED